MKDDRQFHTPLKDHLHANHKIKSTPERNQKNQKSSKKSLNCVFQPVLEDVTLESSKDSIDISTFSEVSEDNLITESTQSFTMSLSPVISRSLDQSPSSEITLLSSINSAETAETFDLPFIRSGSPQSDAEVTGSLEVELVVNHLRQLMVHALNSADKDLRYKKLLNALVRTVIEEFCSLPEERDWSTKIISRRSRIMFLSFMLSILAVSAVFFVSSVAKSSYYGPPST